MPKPAAPAHIQKHERPSAYSKIDSKKIKKKNKAGAWVKTWPEIPRKYGDAAVRITAMKAGIG